MDGRSGQRYPNEGAGQILVQGILKSVGNILIRRILVPEIKAPLHTRRTSLWMPMPSMPHLYIHSLGPISCAPGPLGQSEHIQVYDR